VGKQNEIRKIHIDEKSFTNYGETTAITLGYGTFEISNFLENKRPVKFKSPAEVAQRANLINYIKHIYRHKTRNYAYKAPIPDPFYIEGSGDIGFH
jgi:hypothetical protein